MCQSPGECEHVQLAQTFGQDLQGQLDEEREKTTRQFFRISELQETVTLLAERNAALQAKLTENSRPFKGDHMCALNRAMDGTCFVCGSKKGAA